MGLATRIIPTLLMRGSSMVKGKQFQSWRTVGHIEQGVRVMSARGVDELILLDIAATPEGRGPDFERVADLCGYTFSPVTVGGGVRSVEDVRKLLAAGADKVAINTSAMRDQSFIRDCAQRFGSQAIVVAIDYVMFNDPRWDAPRPCATERCGTTAMAIETHDTYTPMHPMALAAAVSACGAGEILLTSIDREGTMTGYDLELIHAVSRAVDIPVIAHGGCSGPEDMLAAIRAGASAVAAGALFQFTDWTPVDCAGWLRRHGVETRELTRAEAILTGVVLD